MNVAIVVTILDMDTHLLLTEWLSFEEFPFPSIGLTVLDTTVGLIFCVAISKTVKLRI